MLLQGLARVSGVLLLGLAVCATASAQYGGGTGGSGGTGGGGSTGTSNTSGYSYGRGKAIGIGLGVAGAAGVGIALLVHHRHAATRSEASLVGCTQSVLNGLSLKNEKDNQTYMLISGDTPLQPGERVELKGVVAKDGSQVHPFHVRSLVNNYGTCDSVSASTDKPAAEQIEVAKALK
ncbi:MAG TPA: hypothetical protein VE957_13710 [Terriglobales bacterium]|nr:hypothetical protein [Terriglobales bacterium]